MAVMCAVVAVAMTGCGGSPKSVAEKFATAIAQRETEKALSYWDTTAMSEKAQKDMKEVFDRDGKQIDDTKLEAECLCERISIPPEIGGCEIVNGCKYEGEKAKVIVQYYKGKDKKDSGMRVSLVKVDGSWKVTDYDYSEKVD